MPGFTARRLLGPGEGLLWATRTGLQHFDVPGLNPDGTPTPGFLSRAAAGGVGAALMILSPPEAGSDSGRSTPPDVVLAGNSPDGLAVAHGFQFRDPSMWALTTGRLLRAVAVKNPEPEPEPKKKGFFRGVAEVGKLVADVVSSPLTNAGVETSGPREHTVIAEFARTQIRAITLVERKTSMGRRPALRVELVDGSAIDFIPAGADKAQVERMLALSHGAPE
ncbi:hypothetical protein [Actinokineospora xionganensis]|uniref:ESAT-6 protein secretion system EspG family protein n=1 Tax=Actinokineospora xionganensis TaxID=2684470 RepID=A0ABR7L365_9PSEU|nr:hypothetical protein [Actinokineospora xionganensis]MBC6446869.1 hypothetical protein [Actinokineospora xionganensis]